MIYKKFQDLELSALGLGTMRLPCTDGDDARIDEEKTARMVDYAMKNGVNYYDTAWGYHHGNAELVMGRILKKTPGSPSISPVNSPAMTFLICPW